LKEAIKRAQAGNSGHSGIFRARNWTHGILWIVWSLWSLWSLDSESSGQVSSASYGKFDRVAPNEAWCPKRCRSQHRIHRIHLHHFASIMAIYGILWHMFSGCLCFQRFGDCRYRIYNLNQSKSI
jgi:hypothetical protein